MSACRSCKASIRWVITPQGKRLPLDLDPVTKSGLWGTWVIDEGDRARPARIDDAGPRYAAHFSTCPEAAIWRN